MSLAEEDTPLVLADGTQIDPRTGRVVRQQAAQQFVEVPSASEAQRQITAVKRSLVDLPVPPKQMNAISLVVSYTMFGLSDSDIAVALAVTEEQVGRIKMLDAFTQMYDKVIESVISQESDDVRTLIQAHAKRATRKVITTMNEDGLLGFKAAQDILDRAGHRPVDVVDHRHTLEGGLTIEYVQKQNVETPAIDITFTEVEEDGNCS